MIPSNVSPQVSARKFFYGWLLLMLASGSIAFSTDIQVQNLSEFNAAVTAVQPGDTITMAEGVWSGVSLLFRTNGAPGDTVLLRAAIPGRVIINGSSRLRIAGDYLKVDGLFFNGGASGGGNAVIEFRENSGRLANHSRLTNTAIIDYNPASINTDYKWISMYGQYNRVDNCYLRNKTHSGTTLVIWLDGRPTHHRVDHNYFAFRPDLGFNGGETIRIGTSDWSMTDGTATVEYNYFERCNGETEIISNKSGDNIFRYNTFYDCDGILTLRHGNRARIYGNFFIGNFNGGAGGVRIIGEDHEVYNNYFQDLFGSGFRSPLGIMNGVPNSPLNRYFQVKRAKVFFNTFVNCRNPIVVGLGADSERTLPPLDCVIANNVVYTTGSNQIITEEDTPINMTYEGNIMFGSPLGIPATPGIIEMDPRLIFAADSLWRPDAQSPALGSAAGSYPQVIDDVDGQPRGTVKDVGADQQSGDPVIRRPLRGSDVGPHWFPLNQVIQQISPGLNTLADAVENALSGDIIELLPGTYPNDRNITVLSKLTLRAADSSAARPLIQQVDPAATTRILFEIQNGGSLTLDGLELDGLAGSSTPAKYLIRTDDDPMSRHYVLKANNCFFRDVVDGDDGNFFRAYPGTFADTLLFTNCLFTNSGKEGIRLKDEANDSGLFNVDWFQLLNCTFWNTGKEAVFLYAGDQDPFSPGPRVRIDHCTFDNCGDDAASIIFARECDAAFIKNSLFTNSPGNSASVIIEGLVSSISTSDTFNVGPVVTNRGASVGGGMVRLDPLYANAPGGDFTLPLNSPVRGLASDGEALGDLRWAPPITGVAPQVTPTPTVTGFRLYANYPNPFNPSTRIRFTLFGPQRVRLEIFAVNGARVAELLDAPLPAGDHSLEWNAAGLPSGTYFYRLSAGHHSAAGKMLLLQ